MKNKKVGLFKITAFTVCGIIVLDTFVAPTSMGVSSITLWIVTSLLFFIPYGLINAELGAAYPEDGGIFSWVKRAYGEFYATLVGWYYWVNVALWMPAVFIAFTTWLSFAFFPDISLVTLALIAITMCWVVVFICIKGIQFSVMVTNIAAILKVVVLVVFFILGVLYAIKFGPNNDFSAQNFIPKFHLDTFVYISAIVFNLLGFELISSFASVVEKPEKNIPKMTVLAGVIIALLYILGTIGVLIALPYKQIDPLDGFLYALKELTTVFGKYDNIMFKLIVSITLFTLVSNMISWSIASVEVFESANFAKKSKLLSAKHKKYHTPYIAYIIMGLIATLLILINFAFTESANEAFWTILAFSFVIFLLPYLWLFPSALKLRKIDSQNRPYKIAGGSIGLYTCVFLGFFFIASSIVLLFVSSTSTLYLSTLVIGTFVITLIGVILYKKTLIK